MLWAGSKGRYGSRVGGRYNCDPLANTAHGPHLSALELHNKALYKSTVLLLCFGQYYTFPHFCLFLINDSKDVLFCVLSVKNFFKKKNQTIITRGLDSAFMQPHSYQQLACG